MKTLTTALFSALVLLSACRSSKDYLERRDEDKSLQEAVKRLAKSPDDAKALEAVPVLYKNIKESRLAKIASYQRSTTLNKWDKIVSEYNALQQAYELIVGNTAAFKLVTPESYATHLIEVRDSAASDYYTEAERLIETGRKADAKTAYTYYKKSDRFVRGYKDVAGKMRLALENAVVNVVVNPIWDNSFFSTSGFGSYGLNYSNEYFQQTLVRELNYENNNNLYAARFFSDWDLRRTNLLADWEVDLRLSNMDIPYPQVQRYQRNVSNRIEIGKDTSGRTVYQTVNATMYITRRFFNARGNMEVTIRDMENRGRVISSRSFNESVSWNEETATYSGDQRALSNSDLAIIDNSRYRSDFRREDVLTELYKKFYPRVKNEISYAVRW